MKLVAGHQVGDERLIRGHCQHRARPDQKRERQQEGWGHLARDGQAGKSNACHDEERLDGHHQAPAVERIGEHAADDAEEHVGQVVGGLDECYED